MTNTLKLGKLYVTAEAAEQSGGSAVVVAVIAPDDLEDVLDVLEREGAHGYHVTKTQARRCEGATAEVDRGVVHQLRLSRRLRLEVAVPAARASELMAAIRGAAVRLPIGDDDLFALGSVMRGASTGSV